METGSERPVGRLGGRVPKIENPRERLLRGVISYLAGRPTTIADSGSGMCRCSCIVERQTYYLTIPASECICAG